MTLQEFKQLDHIAQIEAFWHARIVGKYHKDPYSFECRQVDDFYVEYKTDGNKILEMRCHHEINLLNPYYIGQASLNSGDN